MTNMQLIYSAAIAEGLYSEEEAAELLVRFGRLPLFTFKVWRQMGQSVKKGEHAKLVVRLWQRKNKKKAGDADAEAEADGDRSNDYYLKTCYLFTPEQVEKLTEKSEKKEA